MISLGIDRIPRPEIRSDATYQLIDALTTSLTGTSVQTWAAGAVETAAGLWSRGLATADVGDAPIGPAWLAEVGRDLARQGQAVYLVDVAGDGRTRLSRAYTTDVWGDVDPASWWYRLTVCGPRTTETITAPAARMVHIRYATERHSPHRGITPLQFASLTGSLAASLERSLGYEAAGAVARLIPLPEGHQDPAELLTAIKDAKGRTVLPESTQGGYGDTSGKPARDWSPQRLGADPPAPLISLRGAVEDSVLACYGIPSPLGPSGRTDGTAMRESSRRFWNLTVRPLLAIVSEELSRALERPIRITHGQAAGATDVAARARAVHVLQQAGVPLDDAMQLAGWND